ncbi:MAG TPA: acyl-CoA dehydrogenase family protein, partial [Dehalococcoidia bacterium]|nr:acyl-CoA dehydrogenase family protein [Dehalococcoidia bacterium]
MRFDVTYTAEQEAFRREVREWLAANVPPGLIHSPDPAAHTAEQHALRRELGRRLGARGWLYPTMPREYGGGGLDVDLSIILHEELDRLHLSTPPYYDTGGLMGGPTILVWGTEEQKQYFLPRIFTGQVKTWQLLTEPEAGSDLAGVRTTAIRNGDEYVINGQKIFVGSDHGADQYWTICVTDPGGRRHQNVSWFMIPADLPGITVQPMHLLTQDLVENTPSGHKNVVYFEDVRVPAFNLVGGENQGWRAASTHLEVEHGGTGHVGRDYIIERFYQYCRQATLDG